MTTPTDLVLVPRESPKLRNCKEIPALFSEFANDPQKSVLDVYPDQISPEPNSGCWLWTASGVKGYGRVNIRGHGSFLVHRISYQITKGKIPEGHELDHLCRVPACVNPDHLEPVSALENQRRRHIVRIARSGGRCVQGHLLADVGVYRSKNGSTWCRQCTRDVRRARYYATGT